MLHCLPEIVRLTTRSMSGTHARTRGPTQAYAAYQFRETHQACIGENPLADPPQRLYQLGQIRLNDAPDRIVIDTQIRMN